MPDSNTGLAGALVDDDSPVNTGTAFAIDDIFKDLGTGAMRRLMVDAHKIMHLLLIGQNAHAVQL